jgi:hypothetical protein
MRHRNVAVPPQKPLAYLKQLKRDAEQFATQLEATNRAVSATTEFKDVEGYVDDYLEYTLSAARANSDSDLYGHEIEHLLSRLAHGYSSPAEVSNSLARNAEWVEQFKDDNQYVRKLLRSIIEECGEIIERLTSDQVADYLSRIERYSDALYDGWSREFSADDTGFPLDTLEQLLNLPAVVATGLQLFSETQETLQAQLYLMTGQVPPVQDVEVLYHASVDAAGLYAAGFDPAGAAQQKGIGQMGGVLSRTSFTADEYIAAEIARTLLEAHLIAIGEVDGDEMLYRASEDGVLEQVVDSHLGSWGTRLDATSTPEDVFKFYTAYLAFAESAGTRYNPLFSMAEAKDFEDVDPNAIGYLACQVDMTDPDIEYLASMQEYRVPATSILDCPEWHRATTPWR